MVISPSSYYGLGIPGTGHSSPACWSGTAVSSNSYSSLTENGHYTSSHVRMMSPTTSSPGYYKQPKQYKMVSGGSKGHTDDEQCPPPYVPPPPPYSKVW
jgi:hypothetical protein